MRGYQITLPAAAFCNGERNGARNIAHIHKRIDVIHHRYNRRLAQGIHGCIHPLRSGTENNGGIENNNPHIARHLNQFQLTEALGVAVNIMAFFICQIRHKRFIGH